MKKIFFANGLAKIEEVALPEMLEGWVLVKTHYSFISSGTERQTLSNQAKNLASRFIESAAENLQKITNLIKNDGIRSTIYQIKGASNKSLECGYACSGAVVWAGINSGFNVGDLVACAGAGFALHAEFVAVPKNLTVKLSDSQKLKQSSCTAIASVAMQGFRQTDCKLGETIVVFGLGLVGLLAVQIAKAAGCKIIGIDLEQERLDLATSLGCDKTLLASDPQLNIAVNFTTAGHGVDAVLICTGSNSEILNQALNFVRRKGKIVIVGDCKLEFSRHDFYQKEASIIASCSYGPGRNQDEFERQGLDYPIEFVRWTEKRNLELCAAMIAENQLKIDPLINNVFCFNNAQQAFEMLKQKNALGVVLDYEALENKFDLTAEENSPSIIASTTQTTNFNTKKNKFNVAVVGAGGFAKTKLIPEIIASGQANLYCLVDCSSTNLINAGAQFKIDKKYKKIELALADPNVDVLVIATPHSTHAQLAMQGILAGKAVFIEKPPAVNLKELDGLVNFLQQNPQALYGIDFNRSSSPFFDKISKITAQRSSPLIVNYRVNAGFLAPNHWIYQAENNGRIIGEACHMLEFILALVNSPLSSLSVSALPASNQLARDNFATSLVFQDGSQATLTYTSLGSTVQEKERVEIFWEGRSVVLNDFIKLQGFGLPFGFNKTSLGPEKGYKQLLQNFFTNLRTHNLANLNVLSKRGLEATKLAILVQELILEGGGFLNFKIETLKQVLHTTPTETLV